MRVAQAVVDDLLARSGRMCTICQQRHSLQIHHIVPRSQGSDDADNAIPLCPNCHNEFHTSYAIGRTTRSHTAAELHGHLKRTIALAARQESLARGASDWSRDVELIQFYGGCLDRPAFRAHFHNESSFAEFDVHAEVPSDEDLAGPD